MRKIFFQAMILILFCYSNTEAQTKSYYYYVEGFSLGVRLEYFERDLKLSGGTRSTDFSMILFQGKYDFTKEISAYAQLGLSDIGIKDYFPNGLLPSEILENKDFNDSGDLYFKLGGSFLVYENEEWEYDFEAFGEFSWMKAEDNAVYHWFDDYNHEHRYDFSADVTVTDLRTGLISHYHGFSEYNVTLQGLFALSYMQAKDSGSMKTEPESGGDPEITETWSDRNAAPDKFVFALGATYQIIKTLTAWGDAYLLGDRGIRIGLNYIF